MKTYKSKDSILAKDQALYLAITIKFHFKVYKWRI